MQRHRLALTAVTSALAVAVPISSTSAAGLPGWSPAGLAGWPAGGWGNNVQPGAGIGSAGCVGMNKPSQVGGPGGTAAGVCGVTLSFVGPQVGQIASAMGPTIIGGVILAPITVSNGSVQQGAMP